MEIFFGIAYNDITFNLSDCNITRKWRFSGVVVGKVAGDESSLDAAEASIALRLRASVLVDEMTVVSEVP